MTHRIVILGGGESGVGAALLAQKEGYSVFLSDIGLIQKQHKHQLSQHGIEFEEGRHSEEKIHNANEVVKSPGIPDTAPVVEGINRRGIPLISEIEFACRHTRAKMIGITGTNGKTTTTLLTYHLLSQSGINVGLAGNVGESLARKVAKEQHDHYVVELSSFQLDGMVKSRMNIAILLNITPDHLNRYNSSMDRYIASKFRITRNMRSSDSLIYNHEDHLINSNVRLLKSRSERIPFGLEMAEGASAYANKNYLMFREGQKWKRLSTAMLPLKGYHNQLNIMAAVLAARKAGVPWNAIKEALPSFANAPHRMERVSSILGIDFYNDSKATNVDAVKYALDSFEQPIIWIAGGIDKGNEYEQISALVKKRVKALVALGTDTKKLQTFFTPILGDVSITDSIFKAVEIAYSRADRGDIVLLSPACASFDLFKNYEERGNKFKEAVRALKDKEENPMIKVL